MSRIQLDMENLQHFDYGKADVAYKKAMQTAVRDCMDRGMDGKPRKVLLTTVLEPIVDADGITEANVHFEVAPKLPAYSTAPKPAVMHKQGQLTFSVDSPDNPHQSTLMDKAAE